MPGATEAAVEPAYRETGAGKQTIELPYHGPWDDSTLVR